MISWEFISHPWRGVTTGALPESLAETREEQLWERTNTRHRLPAAIYTTRRLRLARPSRVHNHTYAHLRGTSVAGSIVYILPWKAVSAHTVKNGRKNCDYVITVVIVSPMAEFDRTDGSIRFGVFRRCRGIQRRSKQQPWSGRDDSHEFRSNLSLFLLTSAISF